MECDSTMHTVTSTADELAGTVIESNCNDSEHKLQLLWKIVAQSSLDTRREIKHILTDLGVMTRTDVEAIVESRLTKWKSTLQSKIIKSVESTFNETFQASNCNQSNGLKPPSSMLFNRSWSSQSKLAGPLPSARLRCIVLSRPGLQPIQFCSLYAPKWDLL